MNSLVPPDTCSDIPHFSFLSVSRPDKVFFPPVNWKVTKNYGVEQDVGPAVEHIYEVISHVLSCADSGGAEQIGLESRSYRS